ncbi:MAG: hypothetical protein K8I27_05015 [Planctomycetes bacterium]|nr:hypothetical protein [Planctomycetota bacterium]
MANWLKGLFGKEPQSQKIKDAAKEAGVFEGAIRHKDGRKIRNDAHTDNLEKNVEKRARKRRK